MLKTLLGQVKEFRLLSILTPVCMIGEVICEMIIPVLMGRIVDRGVMAGNVQYIIRTGAVMIVVALLGLTAGVLGGFLLRVPEPALPETCARPCTTISRPSLFPISIIFRPPAW